jgi:DNA recombination protein RmuC
MLDYWVATSLVFLGGIVVLYWRKVSEMGHLQGRFLELQEAYKTQCMELDSQVEQVITLKVRLEEMKLRAEEKIHLLRTLQEEMQNNFKLLSSDALRSTQTAFFEIAKETFEKYQSGVTTTLSEKEKAIDSLVKPLRESLEKVDHKIQELEKSRVGAYSGITEQLKGLAATQEQLQTETANLVKALRVPHIRGKWGEVQLRRVVEMAGMVERCDFVTQCTVNSEGGPLRPDLIVKLPNERTIIIDAKAPLSAYLEAVEAADGEVRQRELKEHARQLRKHLSNLGDKAYFEQFPRTPEFVVLFLPAESFFSTALEHDPSLIEYGVDKKVLIATPTTLIALLRAVALGWREEAIAEHAQRISELGKSLYERLVIMVEHFQKLKRALESSCVAYNKLTACFETRVLVAARRFTEMGLPKAQSELAPLEPIESVTRSLEPEQMVVENV